MKRTKTSNIPASVHHRLLTLAKAREEDLSLVMKRFGIERFLYRMSKSPYSDQYVLKGAMLFPLWKMRVYRPTRDLDLLGFGEGSEKILKERFRKICAIEVEEDGLFFDQRSISIEDIREDQEYPGQRVQLITKLGKAPINLQIDVGFGDVVTPEAEMTGYPTLLDFPAPRIRAYPKETVVAEKMQATVALEMLNSRMKDFYDIWAMSQEFDFAGETLVQAIELTFQRRRTAIPAISPVALTAEFAHDPQKIRLWKTFLERNRLNVGGREFGKIIEEISSFLMPPLLALADRRPFIKTWAAGGPWR